MKKIKHIQAPLSDKDIAGLKAGDEVLLSGEIYAARDQAHLRITGMIKDRAKLPFDLKGQVIYYCGPAPSGKRIIGSCGPTTSGRMDPFTPELLAAGIKGMIGKGRRDASVVKAIKRFSAVYLVAPAGAGAYLMSRVKKCEVVAFEDLGPEAVYRMTVEDFPLVTCIDCKGRDLYDKM